MAGRASSPRCDGEFVTTTMSTTRGVQGGEDSGQRNRAVDAAGVATEGDQQGRGVDEQLRRDWTTDQG